ncbi:SDR family oxidoreductase [Paracoccus aestuarii]|uniref:SDR family oxidoreductase n=1 Tax=Paracoccus aestuarii TaxID=453842 RepID=A0A418ZZB6_9RHOB|nr:SDR family oxidoreductase [Paracoccus aestuarii]RJL05824.1 SDR family oxidoreductase [Paracoccus aestuarii]WCR01011.1 SDR family oxidoreductase [Paracoccus aestuarii]
MVQGRTVLITGASRGIGAAAARAFAQAGAVVGLMARDGDAVAALARELDGVALQGDVSDAAAMQDAVARMTDRTGRLDVLVNNAGLIGPMARIEDADPADWARTIDVNVMGVFHGMRAALPVMRRAGGGTILTVGSGAAHKPQEGWSAYCASKAGALMLTAALDHEARADGIRAISLSPGTVATDMQAAIRDSGINPVSRLDWSAHIPPEWPARALVWMCSAEADDYLGAEVSLRDEALRRRIGLI